MTATTRKTIGVGRPPEVYIYTLELLDATNKGTFTAEDLLAETIRQLIIIRDANIRQMNALMKKPKSSSTKLPLSSDAILHLMEQHLTCKNSSRLPVLIVSAAYKCAGAKLGKAAKPLKSHNAADFQTKAFGDVEIFLIGKGDVIAAYEMKMKPVSIDDIDAALSKITRAKPMLHNYVFITTAETEKDVLDYAAEFYYKTGGTEIVILDCVGFLRHFLHLFYELRIDFLDSYQELVLKEPDSAVSHVLKMKLLQLRKAAESTL